MLLIMDFIKEQFASASVYDGTLIKRASVLPDYEKIMCYDLNITSCLIVSSLQHKNKL